jgi:hypothetical protein
MLTEIYISALLVDEELADPVWEYWDRRLISDSEAAWCWWCIFIRAAQPTGCND